MTPLFGLKNSEITDQEVTEKYVEALFIFNYVFIFILFFTEVTFGIYRWLFKSYPIDIQYITDTMGRPLLLSFCFYVPGFLLWLYLRKKKIVGKTFWDATPLFASFLIMSSWHYFNYVNPGIYAISGCIVIMSTLLGRKNTTNIVAIFGYMNFLIHVGYYAVFRPEIIKGVENYEIHFLAASIGYLCCYVGAVLLLKNEEEKITLLQIKNDDNNRLYTLTITDGLTMLNNHAHLIETIKEWSSDKASVVHLAMIDIDHFKKVNDKYGHPFGNVVLKRLAEIMKQHENDEVFVARYGGEEFCVVTKNKNDDWVYTLLTDIRLSFEEQEYRECRHAITLSAGIARYNHAKTLQQNFDAADKALYISKETGRNKVTQDTLN